MTYDNVCPAPHKSIAGTIARVMRQVDHDCFTDVHTRYIDPFYSELCLIISEVFLMDPQAIIRINGTEMPAALVQEVYGQLRHGHILLVAANFREVSCRVYNKKAYLRTALYNAVFEIESSCVNEAFCYD